MRSTADGTQRWTVPLLAKELVELKIADHVSTMTGQRPLKIDNRLAWPNPGSYRPTAMPRFVAAMEALRAIQPRPHDPLYPVGYLNESNK